MERDYHPLCRCPACAAARAAETGAAFAALRAGVEKQGAVPVSRALIDVAMALASNN